MTSHPHRNRDDENEPSIEEMVGEAAEPLIAELREKLDNPARSNGVPPGLKPGGPSQLAAQAVAEALGQHLPQMLFQAVAAALQQVPVQAVTPQHMCAECLKFRIAWENAHHGDMEKAMTAAAQAAGILPGTPEAGRLDLIAFLPPDLRPGERNGMPNVGQAATTVGGTEVCPMHIPGVQGGRSPLVVATAAMSPAMLSQFAGAR